MIGSIDWKWLLVGVAFALFVLPFLMNMLRTRKAAA